MTQYEELNDTLSQYIRQKCMPDLMHAADLRLKESNVCIPREFYSYLDRFKNFEVREDDVWVISYPKCGTIWTQEMVWLIGNDLEYDVAKKELIYQRFPFLEAVALMSDELKTGKDDEWVFKADTISYCEELPSPRYIKSHLPVSLLPDQIWTKKPKIIYLTRNPKDAAVSYYHHHRLWNGYTGDKNKFMEAFIQDKLIFSPFWDHVIEYKKLEGNSNILINSYEDMQNDLLGVIRNTASFLGRDLTDEEVTKLRDHLSFSSMKENTAINGEELIHEVKVRHGLDTDDPDLAFIRKGKVGSWKSEMTVEMSNKFDEWIKAKTAGTCIEELANKYQSM